MVAIPTLFTGNSVTATPVATDNFNDNRRDSSMWNAIANGRKYAETPDHSSLDITSDLDIRVAVALDDWTPDTAAQSLLSKWEHLGDQRSYALDVLASPSLRGRIQITTSVNGIGSVPSSLSLWSTVAPTVSDGGILAVRATLDFNTNGRTANFYTKTTTASTAAADVASNSGWTALGSAVTNPTTGSVYNSTAPLKVGHRQQPAGVRRLPRRCLEERDQRNNRGEP